MMSRKPLSAADMPLTEEQRVALGFRPRTLHGYWFWLRYWSPPARWWLRRRGH